MLQFIRYLSQVTDKHKYKSSAAGFPEKLKFASLQRSAQIVTGNQHQHKGYEA